MGLRRDDRAALAVAVVRARVASTRRQRGPEPPPEPRGTVASCWRCRACAGCCFVNWLLSASWDIHEFCGAGAGPCSRLQRLDHRRGTGHLPLAVTVVRFIVPARPSVDEIKLLCSAMLVTGSIFALSIVCHHALADERVRRAAGADHRCGAAHRGHGAITFHRRAPWRDHRLSLDGDQRLNGVMPLAFGAAGTVLGPGVMFWIAWARWWPQQLGSPRPSRRAGSP